MAIHDDEISFQLRGRHDEEEHILLGDFVGELVTLLQALQQTDFHLSQNRTPTTYYQVVDLHHTSPAVIVVKAKSLQPDLDRRIAIVSTFYEALSHIQQRREVPENLERAILETYRNLAIPLVKQRFTQLTVSYMGDSFDLTPTLVHQIDGVLEQGELKEEGSITGRLEEINIHAGANEFRIYPRIGPSKVLCYFPKHHIEKAIQAVGKHVNVYGTLLYKARERFPYKIQVSDLDAYPPDNELPTLDDLRGIAPEATGDIPSEEFVRKLRIAWQ